MGIAFGCACGLTFDVPKGLATKVGRCPACSRTLEIPDRSKNKACARVVCASCGTASAPAASRCDLCGDQVGLAADSAQAKCPSCRAPADPERTLCPHCGYDFETRRMPPPATAARTRPDAGRPGGRATDRGDLEPVLAPFLPTMPILLHLGEVDPGNPEGWRWAEGLVGKIRCPGCKHSLSAREVFLLAFGDRLESKEGFGAEELERGRPLIALKSCPRCFGSKGKASSSKPTAASPDEKIRFECPECGKSLSSTRAKIGTSGRCPGCQKTFWVPGDD